MKDRIQGYGLGGVVALVFAVWLIYLTVEVAKHVNAWPFS